MKHYIIKLFITEIEEGYDDFWVLIKDTNSVPQEIKKELIHCWLNNTVCSGDVDSASCIITNADYENNIFQIKFSSESDMNDILNAILNTIQSTVTTANPKKISWEEIKEFGFLDINDTQQTLQYSAKISLLKYKSEL